MGSLDKYYTKFNVAQKCVDFLFKAIEISEYSLVIEPSAGSGAFIRAFQEQSNISIIGYDIEPDDISIVKRDFLSVQIDDSPTDVLCLGNPPFGRQNNLAVKFFNHCASFENVKTIAMIFPKTFRKSSIHNRLNPYFHLHSEYDIEDNSFESVDATISFNIPCIFQIWNRQNEQRPKHQIYQLELNQVEFVKNPNDIQLNESQSIIAIRRVGYYAGKTSLYTNQNKQSHYFLLISKKRIANQIIEFLNDIQWEFNDTVGARSISKQQFIMKLNEMKSH